MLRHAIRTLLGLSLLFAVTGANAFQLLEWRWQPQAETTMYGNFNFNHGRSPSGTTWNDAFQDAVDQWNFNSIFRFNLVQKRVDPCNEVPGYEGEQEIEIREKKAYTYRLS